MPTLSSRKRPWPYDLRTSQIRLPTNTKHTINDWRPNTIGDLRPKIIAELRAQTTGDIFRNGLMLVPSQTGGLLVGKKQENLSGNYPQVAGYDSAPPYRERTFEFRPTGGMGESVQSSGQDARYHYALDMWVTGGLFGLGPLVHNVTPPTTGRVRLFVEALSGGSLHLFALAGANVLQRDDDTNAGMGSIRNRPGQVAMDAVRFTGAYAGAVDALYVAWDDGLLEEWNGSAWTACALPAGFNPSFLCRVGDELWAADPVRCHLRKVTNDPKVAGSWSGPILVGTPSIQITALRQTTNRLVIFKSDGDLFTINGDGSDNDMYPGLENTVDADNCRTAAAWQGSLWFRAGRAFWQLDVQGGAVLTPSGPGRNLGNLSEVRGPVQAFAGWNSQMAFGAIYNEGNGNSYLLTYGNWTPTPQSTTGTQFTFTNQWDGAIAHWVGRKVTALWVSAIPYDSRLYVGFEDGGYAWIKLVPYPLVPNSGAEFTGDGAIFLPLHHAMLQADNKHTVGFSAFGPYFPLGTYVQPSYRLRGSAGMPAADPTNQFLIHTDRITFNGQRVDLDEPVTGKALEVQIALHSDASDQTDILEGVAIHERLVPAFKRDFSFTVDAREHVARRDGATIRQSGRWTRDLVLDLAEAPALTAFEFPDETIMNVAMFQYQETMQAHPVTGSQAWTVDCTVTQFGTIAHFGQIGRFRGTPIGNTRGFQISTLHYF